MAYANNKGADQPVHPRSMISTYVVRCLDSIISLDSIAEISRLYLASVAAQAGLCLAWSQTPEDTFSRVVAQFYGSSRINARYVPKPGSPFEKIFSGKTFQKCNPADFKFYPSKLTAIRCNVKFSLFLAHLSL